MTTASPAATRALSGSCVGCAAANLLQLAGPQRVRNSGFIGSRESLLFLAPKLRNAFPWPSHARLRSCVPIYTSTPPKSTSPGPPAAKVAAQLLHCDSLHPARTDHDCERCKPACELAPYWRSPWAQARRQERRRRLELSHK